ncbi:MAG: hypothetical protein BWY76_00127 [bacterium ADurb.Bin429]|nr:MAG: hypothetical protein BWY76_00127 [bacterium ADurb.Bin429]
MLSRIIRLLIVSALLACAALVSAQGYAEQYAPVPEDGVIILTDYGFREWGPELVHYALDTKRFKPGKLVLLNDAGQPVPFQLQKTPKGAVLAFVATVAKGGTSVYRLTDSPKDRGGEGSTLTYRETRTGAEVGNEYFSLMLPLAGKVTYKPARDAAQVTPPILKWRQAGCGWVGNARFATARQVTGREASWVAKGPACITYRVRYTFEPKGEYVWQVRVTPGVPQALITEEFDFGEVTEGKDFLLLGLGEGWQPEQIGVTANERTEVQPLAPYLQKKQAEGNTVVGNVSSNMPPLPPAPGEGFTLLEKITATGTWGPKTGIDLRAKYPAADRTCIISAMPAFHGSWRRALAMTLWHDPQQGVQLALPISMRPIHWYLELSDDQSPFCSHEHDQELPATYGRRVWALGFDIPNVALQLWPAFKKSLSEPSYQGKITDPIVKTRAILSYIGLDRYKEWIIDWPETAKPGDYPRAFATPAIAARLKKSLEQHPDKELLRKLYIINGKPESAVNSAKAFINLAKNPYVNDWQVCGLTAYIAAYSFHFAVYADDALACPELPADLRKEVRRYLALYSYLFAEPDRNPRGAGMHLGNPNMPIGRTLALAEFAPILPDHPRYDYWMSQLKEYTAFKLAALTEPGGAWFEPPTYQMYGPTRSLAIAQYTLKNAGYADLAKFGWHAKALEYDANLTMPDVRFKGWRILPGMGNSGNTLEAVWGHAVGVMDGADPDTAGYFQYMHRLASGNRKVSGGGDGTGYTTLLLPDVPEKPRPLSTTFITGYGVAFRAHYGTPDETGLLFRCGYNKSHWDMDDLNTILYGKGAPLSPGTGYQYYYGPANANNAIYHNRVKIGKLDAQEPFGRCENVIQDYGFGGSADYAVGREYYPPEYFTDGKGEMEWRRHVLFLKSANPAGANYFVMRDTFPGGKDRATWWHWLNLDGPENIQQQGNTLEMKTKYGASTWFWFTRAYPGKAVLTFDYGVAPNYHHRAFWKEMGVPGPEDKETKTIYQLAGKPGEDYFYVAFPRKGGEATPKVTLLGDGALKIVTAEATDYVFASDAPMQFAQDDVVFTGKAGAVRVFPDRVVLCMNSGNGVIGYKGYVLNGPGPFERTVKLADIKQNLTQIEGYEKKIVSQEIGNGLTVTGEAPFEAGLDGEAIRIRTKGRARVFTVTRPPFMWQPQFFLDGQEWMAYWSDEASSNWGKMKNTYLMSVATRDGEHELLIRNRVYNKVWDRQFVPMLTGK